MASYYDKYNYYGEPNYYGSSVTYQEPNNYDHHQPNIYYKEPNNYEELQLQHYKEPQLQYYEELQPQYYEEPQPQYYEDAPLHCHNLEPVNDMMSLDTKTGQHTTIWFWSSHTMRTCTLYSKGQNHSNVYWSWIISWIT